MKEVKKQIKVLRFRLSCLKKQRIKDNWAISDIKDKITNLKELMKPKRAERICGDYPAYSLDAMALFFKPKRQKRFTHDRGN